MHTQYYECVQLRHVIHYLFTEVHMFGGTLNLPVVCDIEYHSRLYVIADAAAEFQPVICKKCEQNIDMI